MIRRAEGSTGDTPLVDVCNVDRTFVTGERDVWALRDVSLQVRPAAFVVLMGPSGSGKTTLLNLMGGLDHPSAGTVSIGGQQLDRLSAAALAVLRRQIGFIFQSFALMPAASAYENVELGLRLARNVARGEWDGRVRRCLHAVGLTPWLHHRPYELSGGQQQRVAIARALVIRPQLILADEPTGDLDFKTGRDVLGLLRSLTEHEGTTVIIATHDAAAAEYASEVYQLRDGRISAPAAPALSAWPQTTATATSSPPRT